ncbi:unnamed protein product, partial [Mesocestoides corti]|uniref:Secreted protein n=1 Tax=Mesocestoides corti TaxID=53468 RepID=A0A0R3UDA2_MESCO
MLTTETLIALLGVCLESLLLPPDWPMLVLGIAVLYALGLCLSHEATNGQIHAETSLSSTPNESLYCMDMVFDVSISGMSEFAIVNIQIGESEEENEEEEEESDAEVESGIMGCLTALAAFKLQLRINVLVIRLLAGGPRDDA